MINPDEIDPGDFRPAGELLAGIRLLDLPPGYQVLEAVVLLKCLDEDGHLAWVQRWTRGLHLIEVLGATSCMRALNERDAVSLYESDEDE